MPVPVTAAGTVAAAAGTLAAAAEPTAAPAPPPAGTLPVATPSKAAPVDVTRRMARRLAGPKGIGGWLLLPIVGLIATMAWSGWSLCHDLLPFLSSEAWHALSTPGTPTYHWLWRPLALFQIFAGTVTVIAPMMLLALLLAKRRAARRSLIVFYVFCCLAIVAETVLSLLVAGGRLRFAGLAEAFGRTHLSAVGDAARAVFLAAVWIPYFLRSRRVRNTLINPVFPSPPGSRAAAAVRSRKARGRLQGGLAVAAVVVLAAGGTFAMDAFVVDDAPLDSAEREAGRLVQEAKAAYATGEVERATALYGRAIETDPACDRAYYAKWSILVKRNDFNGALSLAQEASRLFSTRQAWLQLGFMQETMGDLSSAAESYRRCLASPQSSQASDLSVDDGTVHARLDLVMYVIAISEPRLLIADAVNHVNLALQTTVTDRASLSASALAVADVVKANAAELAVVTPPGYFATFHSRMVAAYKDLQSACASLAAAARENDSSSVAAARTELDAAIDRFNQNDELGTSLIQTYYTQQAPAA